MTGVELVLEVDDLDEEHARVTAAGWPLAEDLADRPRFGLTRNIHTYNPVRIAFHEWADLWHDVRQAPGWRNKLGYIFRHPGWRHDAETQPLGQRLTNPEVAG